MTASKGIYEVKVNDEVIDEVPGFDSATELMEDDIFMLAKSYGKPFTLIETPDSNAFWYNKCGTRTYTDGNKKFRYEIRRID